jgi:L-seryl-tRNA(Ser) seleniumtransferase
MSYRSIPSIEQLRQRAGIRTLETRFGGEATIGALRAAAAAVRDAIVGGEAIAAELVAARIEAIARTRLSEQFQPSLTPVINASGVILHTNL